ncbi:hypothetical protein BV22DRAFT_863972 [Leucogyrophana mollusca]|uniref:Uncharacterized protein n=1 Tax=Leucogyrophana mollusca TaxID=85980 RepID=A0ACB8B2Q8_9AGAM|nr:hypothetical protein BV22DRAFT_863972 [Leucogyrophana mollusca]
MCQCTYNFPEPWTRLTCMLAMILYPDVQERAHAETDAMAGRDTLPGCEHRSSLPYVETILREGMIWHPKYKPEGTSMERLDRARHTRRENWLNQTSTRLPARLGPRIRCGMCTTAKGG